MDNENDTMSWKGYTCVSGAFVVGFKEIHSDKSAMVMEVKEGIEYSLHAMVLIFFPDWVADWWATEIRFLSFY